MIAASDKRADEVSYWKSWMSEKLCVPEVVEEDVYGEEGEQRKMGFI